MSNRMKVEVWSDVICPFCYIGKRKFEIAMEQFDNSEKVELIWKSFQLMPELEKGVAQKVDQVLAESKGMSIEQARSMNTQVANAASQVGLEFNFENTVVTNTIDAHRFSHFAKQYKKQNEAKELLFRSYFTDGKNIGDFETLLALGKELDLNIVSLQSALENNSFSDEVQSDMLEAQQLGVRGVPFFVFDRKYAVSGAQDPSVFQETLEVAFSEWQKENASTKLDVIEGEVCSPDGNCE